MPTYEYECTECEHRFEKFQPMSARPVKRCPECGGAVRRLLGTGGAVIMRGGSSAAPTACGRSTTCCGRTTPCDVRPCDR